MKKNLSFLLLTVFMLPPTRISAVSISTEMVLSGVNKGNNKGVLSGFVKISEGIEGLLRDSSGDPIDKIQQLMEGVTRLVRFSMKNNQLEIDEQLKIAMIIDGFRDQLSFLVRNYQIRGDENIDQEQQKMVEGLTTILYNIMYILIKPDSIGTCLTNILSGVYKVISSVLADGRIDRGDWDRLLKALTSIFHLPKLEVALHSSDESQSLDRV